MHDNYFKYFMFGKYNVFFVSKKRVSACMYFLVLIKVRLHAAIFVTIGRERKII
jgi:hypothetical protein